MSMDPSNPTTWQAQAAPAPVEQAPAPAPIEPAPAPAPVEQAPAPAPVEQAPAPAPIEPAPVEQAPAPAEQEQAPAARAGDLIAYQVDGVTHYGLAVADHGAQGAEVIPLGSVTVHPGEGQIVS